MTSYRNALPRPHYNSRERKTKSEQNLRIENFPILRTQKEIKSFVGLLGY